MTWVHMSLPTYDQKWSLMDKVGIKKIKIVRLSWDSEWDHLE